MSGDSFSTFDYLDERLWLEARGALRQGTARYPSWITGGPLKADLTSAFLARMGVPARKDLGSEYFPTVSSWEWPYGTKGPWLQPSL